MSRHFEFDFFKVEARVFFGFTFVNNQKNDYVFNDIVFCHQYQGIGIKTLILNNCIYESMML